MARDERTFITVHDGMPDHPKIDELSDAAFRLLVRLWCWCSRNRTDGFIREATWSKSGTAKTRRELLAELVHEPGHTCKHCPDVPAGQFVMHDYLEHQRSAAEWEALSGKRSVAGELGAHNRWHKDGRTDPKCHYCAMASAIPNAMANGSQTHGKPMADVDVDVDKQPSSTSSPRERAKRATQAPPRLDVTADMQKWASDNDIRADLDAETLAFLDFHRAKGSAFKDWTAAWRTWMRNSVKFNRPNSSRPYQNTPAVSPAVYHQEL